MNAQRNKAARSHNDPMFQVREVRKGTGRSMEVWTAAMQGVSHQERLRVYLICGMLYTGNTIIHAVAQASMHHSHKQFWVYDEDRTHLLGIFRRIDRYFTAYTQW